MVILALAILSMLGCAGPDHTRTAAQSALVGSWQLVSYEDRPTVGSPVFPYGASPKGLLIYGPTGQMSIQIMKQPHPKVASGDEECVTAEEKQALFDAYVAYFGTYSVDPGRGVVIHHVEGDLWALYEGKDEERPFELSGDRLILKPRWTSGGQDWVGIRVFERVGAKRRGA